jgi:hypothetical protein
MSEQQEPTSFTVAVYLVDQVYGGPEEGGWWFQAGTIVDPASLDIPFEMAAPRVFKDEDAATEHADAVNLALKKINAGRPSLTSVLSEGRYWAQVHPGFVPPDHFPAVTPHYE